MTIASARIIPEIPRLSYPPLTNGEIGYLMGLEWAKRQDWAGPSMEFGDKDYRFGKS